MAWPIEKNPRNREARGSECGLSMKGRKSARGYRYRLSVQTRPVHNLDLVRIQIEALREQTSQLARTASALQRMPQLHYPAPLVRGDRGRCPRSPRHEMRVVLRSHG